MLSTEQKTRYEADGFVVLPAAVDTANCAALRQSAERIIEDFDPQAASVFNTVDQGHAQDEYFLSSGDTIRCFLEDDGTSVNKIGHALHDLDPAFEMFSYAPFVTDLIADLGYTDPSILQSMYILKGPQVGGEVVPHIDHTFLWTEPQTVTAIWFAIDDATVDNGCMWTVPGAHRTPPRSRFHRAGRGTTMEVLHETPWPDTGWIPLEAASGTVVVMHGQLPHKSERNRSASPRHAYTLHVIDRAAAYPEDNWLQRGPEMPLRPARARS